MGPSTTLGQPTRTLVPPPLSLAWWVRKGLMNQITERPSLGDIDASVAESRGELADEAGLVEIGDVDHRPAELGIHPDALDVDDARAAIGVDRSRHMPRLALGHDRHGDQAFVVARSLARHLL